MPCYENSHVYRLFTEEGELEYIGSTSYPIQKRYSNHLNRYKLYLQNKSTYMSSMKILCYTDAKIEELEAVSCETKAELLARERFYIDTRDCVNIQKPGRLPAEYRSDNREKIRQARLDNIDKIKERLNEHFSCSCGGRYTYVNKIQHYNTKKHVRAIKRDQESDSDSSVEGYSESGTDTEEEPKPDIKLHSQSEIKAYHDYTIRIDPELHSDPEPDVESEFCYESDIEDPESDPEHEIEDITNSISRL